MLKIACSFEDPSRVPNRWIVCAWKKGMKDLLGFLEICCAFIQIDSCNETFSNHQTSILTEAMVHLVLVYEKAWLSTVARLIRRS
jgi:hypothetical protein